MGNIEFDIPLTTTLSRAVCVPPSPLSTCFCLLRQCGTQCSKPPPPKLVILNNTFIACDAFDVLSKYLMMLNFLYQHSASYLCSHSMIWTAMQGFKQFQACTFYEATLFKPSLQFSQVSIHEHKHAHQAGKLCITAWSATFFHIRGKRFAANRLLLTKCPLTILRTAQHINPTLSQIPNTSPPRPNTAIESVQSCSGRLSQPLFLHQETTTGVSN